MQLRYKNLFTNTAIFTISGFASKFLVFLLLPLYTLHFSTEQYGLIDLCTTVVSLLLPVLPIQISAAVIRFVIEDSQDRNAYFTIGLLITLASAVLAIACTPPILVALGLSEYSFLVIVMYVMFAFDELFGSFARGINAIMLVGICGIIKTAFVVGLSLLLLLIFGLGIDGYLIAYDVAFLVTNVIYVARLNIAQNVSLKGISLSMMREMAGYSLPLIPNSIIWWINSSSNRLIILWAIGESGLGLFAAANKIPSIIIAVQGFISQSLTLSIFDEYSNGDGSNSRFYGELFDLYGAIMALACSLIIASTPLLALFLFQGGFYDAWRYSPTLLVGTVFGAHTGFLGTFYTASKKTLGMFSTTAVGCIVNLACSLTVVSYWGIEGIGIAYLLSQATIYVLRLRDSRKLATFDVSTSVSVIGYLILIAQCLFAWFISASSPMFYLIQVAIFGVLTVLYRDQIKLGRGILFGKDAKRAME